MVGGVAAGGVAFRAFFLEVFDKVIVPSRTAFLTESKVSTVLLLCVTELSFPPGDTTEGLVATLPLKTPEDGRCTIQTMWQICFFTWTPTATIESSHTVSLCPSSMDMSALPNKQACTGFMLELASIPSCGLGNSEGKSTLPS